jgi:hypothetical protein
MGERAGVRLDAMGEGSFEAFVAVAFLPLALITHLVCRVVPGWPARLGSFELGTRDVPSCRCR